MKRPHMNKLLAIAPALAALLLAGCGDSDVKEVRDWMAQVRRDTRPAVKPLPAPKEFIPYAYGVRNMVDPFNPQKLQAGLDLGAEAAKSPFAPDTRRTKEELENFPLDTMRMVGALQKGGVSYGLVQVDRSVYQVRPGQHIGENFGLVTRVTDSAIDIREVVQDASGAWVQRMSKLELQESKESGK
jgi:type IV pilus assembly protein PilP